MASQVAVRDVDKGAKALIRMLGKRGVNITVGIHAPQGAEPKKVRDEDGNTVKRTLLDVGAWNEFGTSKIPERSFIRGWFDLYEGQNRVTLTNMMRAIVAQGAAGKAKDELIQQALNRLGLLFVGQVQKRMTQGIPPPNAASTVERKGSSTTLINLGQLRSAITAMVHTAMGGGAS